MNRKICKLEADVSVRRPQVFLPDPFKAFIHSGTFDKAVFCLGEKQDMLVKDECSSWYNRVGDFVIGMEQKKANFIYEMSIVQGQSDQLHSRVYDQWHGRPW